LQCKLSGFDQFQNPETKHSSLYSATEMQQ